MNERVVAGVFMIALICHNVYSGRFDLSVGVMMTPMGLLFLVCLASLWPCDRRQVCDLRKAYQNTVKHSVSLKLLTSFFYDKSIMHYSLSSQFPFLELHLCFYIQCFFLAELTVQSIPTCIL